MNNARGPSKTVAAEFLRTIAENARLSVGDPQTRAADLRVIADCIEGKLRWSKGGKRSFAQRKRVGLAVWYVEHRPSNVSVKAAVSDQVLSLAREFGEGTEKQKSRLWGEIEALRKLRRKAGIGKTGK